MRAVVLGVGNILLSDEGIGVHAVNALAARYEIPDEVEIIDGGTSAMDCLDRIAEADFLLIADCVRGGREPGTLMRLETANSRRFFGPGFRRIRLGCVTSSPCLPCTACRQPAQC